MRTLLSLIPRLLLGCLLLVPSAPLGAGTQYPSTHPRAQNALPQLQRLPEIAPAQPVRSSTSDQLATPTWDLTRRSSDDEAVRETATGQPTSTGAADTAAATASGPTGWPDPELSPGSKPEQDTGEPADDPVCTEGDLDELPVYPSTSAVDAAAIGHTLSVTDGTPPVGGRKLVDPRAAEEPDLPQQAASTTAAGEPAEPSQTAAAAKSPPVAEQEPSADPAEAATAEAPAARDATDGAEPAADDLEPPRPPRQYRQDELRRRDRIRACLRYYFQRPDDIRTRSPWGVMHWAIAFEADSEITTGQRNANAFGWLCWNLPCRGMRLLDQQNGQLAPRLGPGYQGHEGQLLSLLAISRVKADYPMKVNDQELKVADLVKYEMATCVPKSELSFKLIALAHYLKSDATWTSRTGETWSIPRLIEEEIAQPINGACCGGTHRLTGLAMAVRVRERREEPMTGQWLRAQKHVQGYQNYLLKLQNRDGSFSTDWFKRRADSGDIDRKLQTTGHMLEWLVFSWPEERLNDPRIVRSVDFLTSLMINNRQREWEVGPRGHALHALSLYTERYFGDRPGQRRAMLANRPTN